MSSTSDPATKPLDLNVIPLFQHKYKKIPFFLRSTLCVCGSFFSLVLHLLSCKRRRSAWSLGAVNGAAVVACTQYVSHPLPGFMIVSHMRIVNVDWLQWVFLLSKKKKKRCVQSYPPQPEDPRRPDTSAGKLAFSFLLCCAYKMPVKSELGTLFFYHISNYKRRRHTDHQNVSPVWVCVRVCSGVRVFGCCK